MIITLFPLLFLFFTSIVFGKHKKSEIPKEHLSKIEPYKIEKTVNNATLLEIFEQAIQSYLNKDWNACIEEFRYLEYKYKKYKNAVIECRKKCRINSKSFVPISSENIEDMHFYEKKIKETLCILICNKEYRKSEGENALKRPPRQQELKLMFAEYYEYLHVCYFQKNYYQEALNTVFTFLIYHPNHEPSRLSFNYYMNISHINVDSIRNLQEESFINDYLKGIKEYNEEYYSEAIKRFESSLKSYIESEEKCRFYCEGPIEHDWNLDFTISLSNHFVYNLHCKRRCSRYLRTLNGKYRQDFLVDHFNYLQFSYYKLYNFKKACEAVETYLLFYPADEKMLMNKNYYASLSMVEENYFTPREEIILYVTRQEYELRLLLYINGQFTSFEDKFIVLESKVKKI